MSFAPDWMSNQTAAALDLGFDVLVPPSVPGPFASEPSVYAAGGYYSLYWVIYGGPPTFLEITGEVGGSIPAGSIYDLNVPLVVNASVQGYEAYRDLTPIYDTVWWQVGNVVYSVSSRNLDGTDSLAVANGLTVLVQPGGGGGGGGANAGGGVAMAPAVWAPERVAAGEMVTIWVEGAGVALSTDGGTFVETGSRSYPGAGGLGVAWQAPVASSDIVVSFAVVDEATGEWLAGAETLVEGTGTGDGGSGGSASAASTEAGAGGNGSDADQESTEAGAASIGNQASADGVLECPPVVGSGRLAPIRVRGPVEVEIVTTQGAWPNEPGNRRFDDAVDGGPDLFGVVADDRPFFLHWRAPTVQTVVEAMFVARGPDGEELGSCVSTVRPDRSTLGIGWLIAGDGSGGPFPDGPVATAAGGSTPATGDGTGGPSNSPGNDLTGGPAAAASPEATENGESG